MATTKSDMALRCVLMTLCRGSFESSSGLTPEFKVFWSQFGRAFRTYLKTELGATEVYLRRGHFEISGHFRTKPGWYYFNTGDVRYRLQGPRLLVRTAEHAADYHGGPNMYIPIDNVDSFKTQMKTLTTKEN